MRSKAPLMLIEQMIMLLVFALAAALCLQAFVKSEQLSEESGSRDRAVTIAQTTAETIRHCGGDIGNALGGAAEILDVHYEQSVLYQDYDENWNPASGNQECFHLTAQGVPTEVPGLWKASVEVTGNADGNVIFALEVSWQEVDGNG